MSEIIDRGVISVHTYPITVLLKVLPHLPSCDITRILPIWEARIIFNLARAFDIEAPLPQDMTYEEAVRLQGEIFKAVGGRFSEYAELGEDDLDIMIRKYISTKG